MYFDLPVDRWLGLLSALGVLLALFVWYAVPRMDDRRRGVLTVFAATAFLGVAARAVGSLASIGSRLAVPQAFGDGNGRTVLAAVLALAGFAGGLLFVTAEGDRPSDPEPEPDDVTMPHLPSPAWLTGSVRVPLAVALALALPASNRPFGLFAGHGVNAWTVVAVLTTAFVSGAALLYVALVTDGLDVRWVAAGFGLLALGEGLRTAFPDVLSEQLWLAFVSGLVGGLLVPAALRLLRRAIPDDRTSLVVGVVIAVLLVALGSVATTRAIVGPVNGGGFAAPR